MIDELGDDLDENLVRVPLSQADLSERCGWRRNDGRVAAYIRDLDAAVVARRGGLVFDRRLLAALEVATVIRPLTRPAITGGTGTPEPFGGRVAHLARLANGDGRNSPSRSDDRLAAPGDGAPRDPDHGTADGDRRRLHALPATADATQGREALLETLVALDGRIIAAQQQLLIDMAERHRLHRQLAFSAPSSAPASAPNPAERAEGAEGGAEILIEEEMRGVGSLQDQPHLLSSISEGAEAASAESAEPAGAPPCATAASKDWTTEELPGLVSELTQICVDRKLQTMTDPAGMALALQHRSRTQIVYAQRELVKQLQSGQRLRSPFGILYKASRDDHPGYFPPTPPPKAARDDDRPRVRAELPEHPTLSPAALAAVDALTADPTRHGELEALDAAVLARRPANLLGRRKASAVMVRTERAIAWQEQHADPAPGDDRPNTDSPTTVRTTDHRWHRSEGR